MINLTTLSDKDIEELRRAVQREQVARRRADTSPEKIEESIRSYQRSLGREPGGEWVQPTGALDSYSTGDRVEHDGVFWVSLIGANVHPPGVSGWRIAETTDEDGNPVFPPYVQPSGAHDAYRQGERITWGDGEVYEATRDGVAHSPADSPADWDKVTSDDSDDSDDSDGFPDWETDTDYVSGDIVSYGGKLYRVVTGHRSQSDWTPSAAPSLFAEVVEE